MKFGHFDDQNREYVITNPETPYPWINYLGNIRLRQPLMKMSQTIFISYGHEDYPAAKRLFDDLRSLGLRPWLDREHLVPGQKWKVAIRRAIRESRFFIALLSNKTVTRRGFLNTEIREAIDILKEYPDFNTFIIPVRLDECNPPQEELWELQRVDMFPDWDAGVKRILKTIGISHQSVTSFIAIQLRRLDAEMLTRVFTSASGRDYVIPGYDKPPIKVENDPLFKFLSSNKYVDEIHYIYGSFDILAVIKAESIITVGEILDQVRKFPNVLNTSTTTAAGHFKKTN